MEGKYYITENLNEACFETEEKVYAKTINANFKKELVEKSGIPIISDGLKGRVFPLEQPFMIVANTASGKTLRIIMPTLVTCADAGDSLIIHDPKGELYSKFKKKLERKGYKTIRLDFRAPGSGSRYNILNHPVRLYKTGKKSKANELFESIGKTILDENKSEKDRFWDLTGASYFAGLCQMASDLFDEKDVNINNIYNLHLQGNKTFERSYGGGTSYIKTYFQEHEDAPYWKLISPCVCAPNETKSSLDSVFTSALCKYVQNEEIVDQGSDSDFSIEEMIEEKVAVFIVSRDESSIYNSLISIFINQAYEILIDVAQLKYGGKLPRRVSFILDEFGNLPAIPDINAKLTISRSRNIAFVMACQSLEQLSLMYGREVAKIILGNCNLAYMYSTDIELLRMISDLCGESDSVTHKKLLSVDALRRFDKESGETLFLLERMNPFVAYLPLIFDYPLLEEETIDYDKRRRKKSRKPLDFCEIVRKERQEKMEEVLKQNENAMKKEETKRRERKEQIESNKKNDPYNMDILVKALFV